jgi:type IV secretory pathway VirB2 component (pilin)
MNNKKRIIMIAVLCSLVFVLLNNVFADYLDPHMTISTDSSTGTTSIQAILKIWSVVKLILQVLSVAAIIVTGIRYMFTSADQKADIKKQSYGLVIGAILVFAASTVVNFIVEVTKDVTGKG